MTLDALDWLELASFQLTRVDGFGEAAPSVNDLRDWRSGQAPGWRRPALGAEALREQAEDHLGTDAWVTGSLRRAAVGTLVRNAGVRQLPDNWARTTLVRWRLPLGTLHAAALAADCGDDPPPHRLHARVDPALQAKLGQGAADIHVHVGAILPFDLLFGLLLQRLASAPRALAVREEFRDSAGKRFEAGPALAVAAALANVVGRFCSDQPGVSFAQFVEDSTDSPATASAVLHGMTWSYLKRSPSRNAPARFEAYDKYFDLQGTTALGDETDPLWAVISEETLWLRRSEGDEHLRKAVEEILRCKALFHHALSQGARTGLTEFLVTSDRLRPLRKLAAESKRDVVRFGLEYLGARDVTTAVELRTSEQSGPDINEVARALALSLDAQFAGYEDFVASGGRAKAAWPICFIRSAIANVSLDSGGGLTGSLASPVSGFAKPSLEVRNKRRVRFDFRDVWALSEIVVHTLTEVPEAAAAIPGFDVAGDEQAVPSWLFALAFRTIDARLPDGCRSVTMNYRVHAGESYASPIEGLRRVDEAVMLVIPPAARPRVGHGLALADPTWSVVDLGEQAADEALDDLVWLWHELQGASEPSTAELVEHLEETIIAVGEELYGLDDGGSTTAAEYHDAYLRRFDDDHLARIGLMQPSLGDWPVLADAIDPSRAEDRADRVLTTYLTSPQLRDRVGPPFVDQTWLREAYDAVQPLVIGRVIAREAIIEACPTSNLVIGGVSGYGAHPMVELVRQGLELTISTDDPGLFGTTLLDEYGLMWPALARLEAAGWKRDEVLEAMRKRSMEIMSGPSVDDAIAALRDHWRSSGFIPMTPA